MADKKIKLPEGFETEEDFLREVQRLYDEDLSADQHNREAAMDDAKFVAGEQWDEEVAANRTDLGKPTLTLNRLLAFVMTVVGSRRLNQTNIQVHPDNGGTKEIAQVREDLLRNIQKNTDADGVYSTALENVIISGQGAFEVELGFANYDVFDQDIGLSSIPNPLATVWDSASVDPTGKDARRCWVTDSLSQKDFEAEYPGKRGGDLTTFSMSEFGQETIRRGWFGEEQVRIVDYWQMRSDKRMVALMDDGSVQDVTDLPEEEYIDAVVVNDRTGELMLRESDRLYAERYVVSGSDVLEGPYRLDIDRVPVIRVSGQVVNVGERRDRLSLVRFAKDPQRLHNYWRSTLAESLMRAPRSKWLAPDTAVEGYEELYREAHNSQDPLLVYNGESGVAPQFVTAPPMDSALVTEAGIAAQDIQDITNIREASLGAQGNEVSGKAITARQRIGELSSAIAQDNLEKSIAEAGRVINQLIPDVYDTPRVIKVVGPDEKAQQVAINGFSDDALDITLGKYALTISTGPSTVTKRAEAAESMLNMINAMPQTLQLAADLVIEAQDWPGSEEIARRLRAALPPGVVSADDLSDEQKQQQAQAAQQAQEAKQKEDAMLQLNMAKMKSEADLNSAKAQSALMDARALMAKLPADIDTEESVAELNEAKSMLAIIEGRAKAAEAVVSSMEQIIGQFRPSQGDNDARGF